MGYMHIDNLYRNLTVLLFRECYALEKIHGTSAHIAWKDGRVIFFSGGAKHDRFLALFDEAALSKLFASIGHPDVNVYGEAYGGKINGQAWRYGSDLRFVAFDVKVGDTWLRVPDAEDVAKKLGLEFVHYRKVPTDLASVDAERDAPSEQARRNGVEGDKPREGVVLRPLEEMVRPNGDRVMAKHKRDDERETRTPRKVDADKVEVLRNAEAISLEWATQTRLEHVLDKLQEGGSAVGIEATGDVIRAMVADIEREAEGEIVASPEARRAIGSATAKLFKAHLRASLKGPV